MNNKIEKQIINAKRQDWHNEKKAEFKALFPDVIELDDDGNLLESFNEAFGSWLNELEQYEVTTTEVDDNGDEFEATNTYSRKIRPMPNFTASKQEIEELYKTTDKYKTDKIKELDITTISNGKRFYTDEKSLIDLLTAKSLASNDTDKTMWKTPDGLIEVSFTDIKEAVSIRLHNKAVIIGAK